MGIAFMKTISWLCSFWWHKVFGHRLVHWSFVSMDYGLWFRAVWNYMHANNVGVLVQCLWQLHPISRWASATKHQNSPDFVTVVRWKNHPDNWSGFGAICDTYTTLVNIRLLQFMKLLFQQCALTQYSATNTQRVYLQCSNFNFDFFITSSSGFRKFTTFSSDFWKKPQRTSSY